MFIGDGVRYLAIDRTLFILLRKRTKPTRGN